MALEVTQISEQLCAFVREQLLRGDAAGFDCASPLRDHGLDSFSLIELLLFSETQFGVRVPDAELTPENLHSLDALARCIRRARPD